ncbi:MAG: substrate-binding domain-containing protein [Lachnospiraceae bacterium]|nr:substrate-binding domain-containing protein [Lachnospiraceae bacterium]
MKKKLLATVLAVAMVMGLVACGSDSADAPATTEDTKTEDTKTEDTKTEDKKTEDTASADGEVKLAVLLKPESNEYWSSMKAGIEEWAQGQDGVSVDVYCAESEDNIQGQLEQMENIISKDYNAICAAPLSASNLVEGVIKACEAGIPVVNVDEAIDAEAVKEGGGNMVGIYTTDNVIVGQKGAEYISEKIGSGQVAIIEGTAGNVTSNNRTKGATDYFKGVDGIDVVASQSGDWDRLTSIDVATNIMQSNPELKAFYCCNDTMALGVYEAVVNAGKQDQVMVVGTDAVQNAKESVKNGEMAATVGQDNVGIGIACCELAVKAAKEGWKADASAEMPVNYIDSFLVTADNVDEYLK